MEKEFIKICWLYSRDMSIYGDRGNIICLKKRTEWRGKIAIVEEYNIGDSKFRFDEVDLFFFGGGQDLQQLEVAEDLKNVGKKIKKQIIDDKSVMLSICGGMQLMCNYYETSNKERIEGTGLFDAYTVGGERRFIGNVLVESELEDGKNKLVGFENHSGRTWANWQNLKPLGKVLFGNGNNGQDGTEGVVYKNAIGSYLHGSLLPKNPWLADWLLDKAFIRRYGKNNFELLDDQTEIEAQVSAIELAKKNTEVVNITSKK